MLTYFFIYIFIELSIKEFFFTPIKDLFYKKLVKITSSTNETSEVTSPFTPRIGQFIIQLTKSSSITTLAQNHIP
jgi:hypothetical protein